VLGFFILFAISQDDLITTNKKIQEKKIAERIQAMKGDPDSLFFARSNLSLEEQRKLAKEHVDEIQRLEKTEGFDYPDYEKILKLASEILRKAPDVEIIQMAHWNIHQLFLIQEDKRSAHVALESYLIKYPDDPDMFRKREAYDKLAVFSEDMDDWGLTLYYAEKYLESKPDHYPLILTKARALIKLGDKKAGVALLERIIKEDEGSVQSSLAMMELEELNKIGSGEMDKDREKNANAGAELPEEKAKEKIQEKILPAAQSSPQLIEQYKKAVSEVRLLAYAIESYFVDYMKYPEKLSDLYPVFLQDKIEADPWGNHYYYKFGNSDQEYWIGCAGSDEKFLGFDQEGLYSELEGKDIIFSTGWLVFGPVRK